MQQTMSRTDRINKLKETAHPYMEQLKNHELYSMIKSHQDVCLFMEHHVFAVWDFMSLLKYLQRSLTCVELPWVPQGNKQARRLINQIVLEEESDELEGQGFSSHFEMYRDAMVHVGANTSVVDHFIELIKQGESVSRALELSHAPEAAAKFVNRTWEFVESDSLCQVATAFTFGREEAIPTMFLSLIMDLDKQFPGQYDMFHYYLDRHIELDGDVHSHLAEEMLMEICEDNDELWAEAEIALRHAIESRITMWDGIAQLIVKKRSFVAA